MYCSKCKNSLMLNAPSYCEKCFISEIERAEKEGYNTAINTMVPEKVRKDFKLAGARELAEKLLNTKAVECEDSVCQGCIIEIIKQALKELEGEGKINEKIQV